MRRAGNQPPVSMLMLLGGLAALPGCAAAPAVNMAAQMLMQNQHEPARNAAAQKTAVQNPGADIAQPEGAQTAAVQTTSPQGPLAGGASSSGVANPLALLGAGLPSVATIASLAQHLGLPVGGAAPGIQAIARTQTLISDPHAARAAPAMPDADTQGDPPAPAKVANVTQ